LNAFTQAEPFMSRQRSTGHLVLYGQVRPPFGDNRVLEDHHPGNTVDVILVQERQEFRWVIRRCNHAGDITEELDEVS
jgi:hypothetical protein